MIPGLVEAQQENLPRSWKLVIFRPAEDPIGNMAKALAEGIRDHETTEAILRSGPDGLVKETREIVTGEAARITSYNVCYTKLLRIKIQYFCYEAVTSITDY